jgi:hypothetical protein
MAVFGMVIVDAVMATFRKAGYPSGKRRLRQIERETEGRYDNSPAWGGKVWWFGNAN